MKVLVSLLCCAALFACNRGFYFEQNINEKVYVTDRGHLFKRSILKFKSDSTYVYIGGGPATTFSRGIWSYRRKDNVICLKTIDVSRLNQSGGQILEDTVYLDLSNEGVNIINKRKLLFKSRLFEREEAN